MFNVLPENFKARIISQYKKRRIIVWLAAVVILQISFLIFLFPSYIYLAIEKKNIQSLAVQNTQAVSQPDAQTLQSFQFAQKDLSIISAIIPSYSLDSLLSRLISLRDSSIIFGEITYQSQTASTSSITLHGTAADRNALLAFSKKVEADSAFENVNLPVSSFAKDKNIDFSMTVTGHI